MTLENFKITEEEISLNGVSSAPDKLTGTAAENKALFDNLVRAVVATSINSLITFLTSSEGASALGAKYPEGDSANLQELLNYAVLVAEKAETDAKEAIDLASAASGVDFSAFVKKTDAALPGGDPGLIKIYEENTYGLALKNGYLTVVGAGKSTIPLKKSTNMPIVPAYLDSAVKTGITTNTEVLTAEEKKSALSWLGAPLVNIGTYLGTGLAGSSNPTKVACNFNPDIVIVTTNYNRSGSGEDYPSARIMTRDGFVSIHFRPGVSTSHPYMTSSASGKFSYVDGFISWHGANVHDQGCQAGVEYSVFAIGGNL